MLSKVLQIKHMGLRERWVWCWVLLLVVATAVLQVSCALPATRQIASTGNSMLSIQHLPLNVAWHLLRVPAKLLQYMRGSTGSRDRRG
jgi:hypothetical protein